MSWVAVLVPLLVLGVWLAASGPVSCSLYRNMGYRHLAKGSIAPSRADLRTAERWFSSSLRAGCPLAPATFGLGHAYAQLGQQTDALSALAGADARIDLRRLLATRAYEAMGRTDEARQEYRKLPRDAAAHFNGLALSADKEGDYEGALRYFSIARLINPGAAKAYYGAAFVLWRRLGDGERAALTLRQALAVDRSDSPERRFYEGLLCYREGRLDCARSAWSANVGEEVQPGAAFDTRYLAYEMLSRSKGVPSPLAQLESGAGQSRIAPAASIERTIGALFDPERAP
jgi:tetratricopeptide (TPR) repeat protein